MKNTPKVRQTTFGVLFVEYSHGLVGQSATESVGVVSDSGVRVPLK